MLLQDHRFSDEIDKMTGYKTKSLLCMPIENSDGEIIGVAQAINKNPGGVLFTEDDEKVTMDDPRCCCVFTGQVQYDRSIRHT